MSEDLELTVHEPHTLGIPPLRPYFRELWSRRRFGVLMARSNLKSQHFDTVLGQLWTVLNPLLLAGVYFLVFGIILGGSRGRPEYLAQLLAGLFFFYYTRNAMAFGSKSITGGGGLIMNTTLPRAILPLSSVLSAFLVFVPMLVVYAAFHLIAGYPVGIELIALLPIIVVVTVFNAGLALALAAVTVYFRDTASFLPFFLRIWLYLSPILYRIQDVPEHLRPYARFNPMAAFMEMWHEVLLDGQWIDPHLLLISSAWALVSIVVGSLIFLTREREFAVRI